MPKNPQERYSIARAAFADAFRDFFNAEGYDRFRDQTSFALEQFEMRRSQDVHLKTASLCRRMVCDHCAGKEPIFFDWTQPDQSLMWYHQVAGRAIACSASRIIQHFRLIEPRPRGDMGFNVDAYPEPYGQAYAAGSGAAVPIPVINPDPETVEIEQTPPRPIKLPAKRTRKK